MIEIIWTWVKGHWAELMTLAGFGTGGIAAGKKMIDKDQDNKIKVLDERQNKSEKAIEDLQNQLDTNTKFDKSFRGEMSEFKEDTKANFNRLERNQNEKFNQVLQILQMSK